MSDVTTRADLKAEALLHAVVDLLKAHPIPLLVPLVLLGLLTGGEAGGDLDPRGGDPLAVLPFYALLGLLGLAVLILVVLATAFAWVMTTRAALHAARGEPTPDLGEAFRATTPQLSSALVTGLLVFVALLVGFALLVVPGMILLAGLAPWAAVLVAEGKDAFANLRRSWELTKGHKWDLFLLGAAGIVITILGSFLLGWIPIIGDAMAGILSGAVSAGLATLGAVFYERRTRETDTPPVVAAPAVL